MSDLMRDMLIDFQLLALSILLGLWIVIGALRLLVYFLRFARVLEEDASDRIFSLRKSGGAGG